MLTPEILLGRARGLCAMILVPGLLASCATVDEQGTEAAACAAGPALSVHCGLTPTTGFDPTGRLWASYVVGEFVYVAWSDDIGSSWSRPVRANAAPEPVYTNGENRPKVAFGPDGEIYVSWTKVTEGSFAGDIRFTRSTDGGRHFEPVRTVNDDGLQTSHRFETLYTDPGGNVYLAWLDKRDQVRMAEEDGAYRGAALYYTVSTDGGRTFAANRKVADHSCECCRIALTGTPDGAVAAFWRHIYDDNIRDHGFTILGPEGVLLNPQRPAVDNWHIEACPHHGPAMASAGDGRYHLAWFTLGERHGIFYGRYDPKLRQLDRVHPVAARGASHPHLAQGTGALYLAWKSFDGERTHAMLIRSADAGRSWSAPVSLASTAGASDHPLLVGSEGRIWLSWHTGDEGLRLVPVGSEGGS